MTQSGTSPTAAELLKESKSMPGPLGAIAYAVLKGLQIGGASSEVLVSLRITLQEHLQRLSDAECALLCDVVYQRLKESADSGKPWY